MSFELAMSETSRYRNSTTWVVTVTDDGKNATQKLEGESEQRKLPFRNEAEY